MQRSLLLDLLRIIAIALVFIAHFGQLFDSAAGEFFGVKNFYYVSLGGVGVSLFLILSGILAGLTDGSKPVNYGLYLLKKILRIYPLYWISVPLAFLGYMLGEFLIDGEIPSAFPNGFGTDLLGSFSGFYAWMGLWGGPYNSPSWFIALIMTMYALFPPLYFTMRRHPHFTLAALGLISITSRYYIGKHGIPFSDPSFYEGIKGWFYRQYGFMPGRPGDWFPFCRIFEFGLGIYLTILLPKSSWLKFNIPYKRPITFMSDLSFPLFLMHFPFLFLVLYMTKLGLPQSFAIVFFIIFLLALCIGVNRLDQKFPRKSLLSRLQKSS